MGSGLACLNILNAYYKKEPDQWEPEQVRALNQQCSSLSGVSQLAEKMHYRSRIVSLNFDQLLRDASLPCIVHLRKNKNVIIFRHLPGPFNRKVKYMDPVKGMVSMQKKEFKRLWETPGSNGEAGKGRLLLLEPMPTYFDTPRTAKAAVSWKLIFQYFKSSKKQLAKIFFCLLVSSFLQLIYPFLTQSLVDVGIETKDLNYITIILAAQLMLVFSRTIVDFIRNHLLLYVSTVVNLALLSDFWIKLTHLPIDYFEQRRSGEILQRISDNKQVQTFLTGTALQTLFAALNFFVFSFILIAYGASFFAVYCAGMALYCLWMVLFLKIRRKINHQLFHGYSKENNASLQLIQGMTEIKLLNIEQSKRWEWENVQSDIFRLNYKNLSYGQIQQAGALFINQGKDVFLIFLAADQVIRGQLSFGSLLAIQYIVGQMSGPVDQFIRFIQDAQNAKNSIDRLNDVHELEDECKPGLEHGNDRLISGKIEIKDLAFCYSGKKNVLKDICLEIPEGKTTAILGVSGSGKTTLMKVLLKYYSTYEGEIMVGGSDLKDIDPVLWRRNCAVVLPEGYIFNETIEKNIAVEFGDPDRERLYAACRVANILEFIEALPEGFQTRLGVGGAGISQGQKQRLLIARAVYRDASFIFFDESTNALDTHTEKTVVDNLRQAFAGKTVVLIAHRLSTIKDADNIVVLNSGRIVEQGSHLELSARRGRYYELMQSQHELNIQ